MMFKILSRSLVVIGATLLLAGIVTIKAKADIISPDFLTPQCQIGETEVDCSYTTATGDPTGKHVTDTCTRYEQNNEYYLLSSRVHSYGGDSRYCAKSEQNTKTLTTFLWGIIAFVAVCLLALCGIVILLIVRHTRSKSLPKKGSTHAPA